MAESVEYSNTTGTSSPDQPGRRQNWDRWLLVEPYFYALPIVLFMTAMLAYPLLYLADLSVSQAMMLRPPMGIRRYGQLLSRAGRSRFSAIMAVGFFSFVTSWAEFVFALVFAGMRTATAPLALAGFVQESYVDWGGLSAASMMFAVPVAILFLYFQRFLVSGLAGGSVKG